MTPLIYKTRGLKNGTFFQAFLKIALVFMSSVFVGIFLQLQVWITTALSLGIAFWVAYRLTAKTTFVLDDNGIQRHIHHSPTGNDGKSVEAFYPWDQIEWYRSGSDLSRSGTEYHFLKIKFKDGVKFSISSQHGEQSEFFALSNAFLEKMELMTEEIHPAESETPEVQKNKTLPIRKKGFYESWPAKALAIFFLLFTLALIVAVFGLYDQPKPSHLFRIFVIMVPGTAYMLYRTFFKK